MHRAALLLLALTLCGCSATSRFALLPGQSVTVPNRDFRMIEVRAEYPVSIKGENCYLPRAVQCRLECSASDVTVTDARPSILVWGRANKVTVTGSIF